MTTATIRDGALDAPRLYPLRNIVTGGGGERAIPSGVRIHSNQVADLADHVHPQYLRPGDFKADGTLKNELRVG